AVIVAVIAVIVWRRGAQAASGPPEDQLPHFTTDGALMPPVASEIWVMVGSSTGLSYNQAAPSPPGAAPGMFHNVYMQPWAYREFVATGAFPEQTMFVLTFHEASGKSAPARAGLYEGDRQPGYEVHLKKEGIDPTGWAFFGFAGGTAVGQKLPGTAPCYSCHATEAAHDNVFTQFYPPLRERLAKAAP
ncbi:MAG TPA: cytochrome P460 family protein, partial [Gemmatimonadales bacterium]|nr:cytochrome P460 family protein [Gemmatimonadales bacterium]